MPSKKKSYSPILKPNYKLSQRDQSQNRRVSFGTSNQLITYAKEKNSNHSVHSIEIPFNDAKQIRQRVCQAKILEHDMVKRERSPIRDFDIFSDSDCENLPFDRRINLDINTNSDLSQMSIASPIKQKNIENNSQNIIFNKNTPKSSKILKTKNMGNITENSDLKKLTPKKFDSVENLKSKKLFAYNTREINEMTEEFTIISENESIISVDLNSDQDETIFYKNPNEKYTENSEKSIQFPKFKSNVNFSPEISSESSLNLTTPLNCNKIKNPPLNCNNIKNPSLNSNNNNPPLNSNNINNPPLNSNNIDNPPLNKNSNLKAINLKIKKFKDLTENIDLDNYGKIFKKIVDFEILPKSKRDIFNQSEITREKKSRFDYLTSKIIPKIFNSNQKLFIEDLAKKIELQNKEISEILKSDFNTNKNFLGDFESFSDFNIFFKPKIKRFEKINQFEIISKASDFVMDFKEKINEEMLDKFNYIEKAFSKISLNTKKKLNCEREIDDEIDEISQKKSIKNETKQIKTANKEKISQLKKRLSELNDISNEISKNNENYEILKFSNLKKRLLTEAFLLEIVTFNENFFEANLGRGFFVFKAKIDNEKILNCEISLSKRTGCYGTVEERNQRFLSSHGIDLLRFDLLLEGLFKFYDWKSVFEQFYKKSQLKILLKKIAPICEKIYFLFEELMKISKKAFECGNLLSMSFTKSLCIEPPPYFKTKNFCQFWVINSPSSEKRKQFHFWVDYEKLAFGENEIDGIFAVKDFFDDFPHIDEKSILNQLNKNFRESKSVFAILTKLAEILEIQFFN